MSSRRKELYPGIIGSEGILLITITLSLPIFPVRILNNLHRFIFELNIMMEFSGCFLISVLVNI